MQYHIIRNVYKYKLYKYYRESGQHFVSLLLFGLVQYYLFAISVPGMEIKYAVGHHTRLTLKKIHLNSFKLKLDSPLHSEGLTSHFLRRHVQVKSEEKIECHD